MKKLKDHLKYLRLVNLLENLEHYLKEADKKQMSNAAFLKYVCKKEYEYKVEWGKTGKNYQGKDPGKLQY